MENEWFDGMTVNERLFSTGLLDSFDVAVEARNRDTLITILSEVAVVDPEATADAILAAAHRNVC
ncbi:hypothetical protein [Sphingomonas sp. GV3]|uniref:hypothetical protein n=1 Tax=Sphingomonas sp. GV3 TaxID=3040671 RepID=UPI00280A52C5|nr:hypothetical protein [Sphingomonas sp. GV3]